MGYSKSKKSIRRVQHYLDQMVIAEGNVEFASAEPTRLIYYIRDGIKAAQHFSEASNYARLSAKFVIKAGPGKVICELRDVLPLMRHQMKSEVSIPDVVDPLGIIGAAIKHHADIMIFPDASHDTILDKTPIQNWADKNGYQLIMAIDHITLEKKDGADTEKHSIA